MTKINLSTIVINGITNRRRKKPYAKSLHGMCYELAGREYEHIHNKPPAFQPVIKEWEMVKNGTNISIEIRIVEEEFYNKAIERLQQSNYLVVGSTEFEIIDFKATKDMVIDLDGSMPPIPEVFKIKFETPTFFRQKREVEGGGYYYVTIPEPSMKTFVHSVTKYIQRRFGYKTNFDLVNDVANKTRVIHKESKMVDVVATQSYTKDKAFVGHLAVDTSTLNEGEKNMLGKIIKIASYSGVGRQKGFGLGKVRIERYDV